jgi:hypothetical protein
MKNAALGVLAGVVAVAIWFSGDWPTERVYGRTGQTTGGALGDLIVLSSSTLGTSTNGQIQQLTLFDPRTHVMSVYHIDGGSGRIELKSIRNIHWDLQMDEFNGSAPLPGEIRALLEQN